MSANLFAVFFGRNRYPAPAKERGNTHERSLVPDAVTVRGRVGATASVCLAAASLLLTSANADAIPLFARQTKQECTACHVSFPELTSFGREFKLRGYTLGTRDSLPLSGMIQASVTRTRDIGAADPAEFPRDGGLAFQQGSLFTGGRITDHLGAFVQWSYDGVAHHSALDNADLRYAGSTKLSDTELLYGFTLHNNPTVQDVWNTTPAFGYPYISTGVGITPTASTLIDGSMAQQVAGLGAYLLVNHMFYAELSGYRTADGAFSVLRAGQDTATPGGVVALDGYNPYWRLAFQREWGPHSMEVGTYGMIAKKFPDNTIPFGPTDRFRDVALDAQYQYITDAHRFSAQITHIREKQDWNTSFVGPVGAGPTPANPSDTLTTFKAKAMYYYQKKYGLTLAYFSTTGDTDPGLYTNSLVTGNAPDPRVDSLSGSPDTKGYIAELTYLPWRNTKFGLQYTHYLKFNGSSTNYDGLGRNAADNNTWFLYGWFMF